MDALMGLVILPIVIFFIRIIDVSLGTIRLIFVSRGVRIFAAVLGFFEVLVWLMAVSEIMKNLHSPILYIAYAAGFGMGNFIGISIENKLSYGHRIITAVTQKDSTELRGYLKSLGCGITMIDGEGERGPVKIIFTVVRKNQVENVVAAINKFNPNAFYTIEDIRKAREGAYPGKMQNAGSKWIFRNLLLEGKEK